MINDYLYKLIIAWQFQWIILLVLYTGIGILIAVHYDASALIDGPYRQKIQSCFT
jgi:hypothetical protein